MSSPSLRALRDRDAEGASTPGQRQRIEDEIVILLAGSQSEALASGETVHALRRRGGAHGDLLAAEELAPDLALPAESAALLCWLDSRASNLVRTHHYLIEALALELARQRTLSGPAITRILRDAIRAAGAASLYRGEPWTTLSAEGWRDIARLIGEEKLAAKASTKDSLIEAGMSFTEQLYRTALGASLGVVYLIVATTAIFRATNISDLEFGIASAVFGFAGAIILIPEILARIRKSAAGILAMTLSFIVLASLNPRLNHPTHKTGLLNFLRPFETAAPTVIGTTVAVFLAYYVYSQRSAKRPKGGGRFVTLGKKTQTVLIYTGVLCLLTAALIQIRLAADQGSANTPTDKRSVPTSNGATRRPSASAPAAPDGGPSHRASHPQHQ